MTLAPTGATSRVQLSVRAFHADATLDAILSRFTGWEQGALACLLMPVRAAVAGQVPQRLVHIERDHLPLPHPQPTHTLKPGLTDGAEELAKTSTVTASYYANGERRPCYVNVHRNRYSLQMSQPIDAHVISQHPQPQWTDLWASQVWEIRGQTTSFQVLI